MKKQCYFTATQISHIDYKDTEVLKKFLTPHARIVSSGRSGVCAKHQRMLALAVKHSRFMGLLPFLAR